MVSEMFFGDNSFLYVSREDEHPCPGEPCPEDGAGVLPGGVHLLRDCSTALPHTHRR